MTEFILMKTPQEKYFTLFCYSVLSLMHGKRLQSENTKLNNILANKNEKTVDQIIF